jgi:predicted lipopolysaccharide heptosyltransferase III
MRSLHGEESPQPLGSAIWNWDQVERVLIIRLRSIGDTVLTTPSLFALKRFLPNASIDILLEDWVAPLLADHPHVDNVLTVAKGSTASRARMVHQLRNRKYDVVYNFHGGTTATILARASGAPHRVGYASYQYSRLLNHAAPSPLELWSRERVHSAEQQLALLGWTGVPVSDRPPTHLAVSPVAASSVSQRLESAGVDQKSYAVIHPAAAFDTKQWAADKFAGVVDELDSRRLVAVVLTTQKESATGNEISRLASTQVINLADLSLPEVTALLSRARLFVGNDSGIAHMAAAVSTPSVVIFGSSNRAHWSPWAQIASEVVYEEMDCQPCHGYYCEKFDEPECIKRVPLERVTAAIDRVLRESA